MKQATNYVVCNFLSLAHNSAKPMAPLSSKFSCSLFPVKGEGERNAEAGVCASQPTPLNAPICREIISVLPRFAGSFGGIKRFSGVRGRDRKEF